MKKIIYIFLLSISLITLNSCVFISSGTVVGDPTVSKYGISFSDTVYQKDGFSKELIITGDLPKGFRVEYDNNKGTEVGDYYATCRIYNENNKLEETHHATLIIENNDNFSFNLFLDQFLTWYLGEDQFASNIFFESPAEFNLEHYDAKWYTYEEEYTSEKLEYYKDAFDEMLTNLHEYGKKDLSPNQRIAYNKLVRFFKYYKEFYSIPDSPYLNNTYIDQFGGYVSSFISSIEAYNIRSEQDIIDMIDLVNSTKTAFPSYLKFVKDKFDKGYGYSDYTLNEMISYLEDLYNNKKDFYLISALVNKIKNSSIDSSKHSYYIDNLNDAFTNSFYIGINELSIGLKEYLGNINQTGYWATYEYGDELYEIELEHLLGVDDLDVAKYIDKINKELKETTDLYQDNLGSIARRYLLATVSDVDNFVSKQVIFDGSTNEMLNYLKEFAKKIVPELDYEPNILVTEMDEASAKVSNAVAYYTKSAIDAKSDERITLNPLHLSDKNNVLSTLAHEGYPGHLYAYCFMKSTDIHPTMKIMSSTVHAEGWATYVVLALYDNIINTTKDSKLKAACEYLYSEQLNGYLLETKIDLGIHLEDWSISTLYDYLDKNGYNKDAAEYIFNRMIELPVTYNAYGFGKVVFNNLHVHAKEILQNHYNEVDFNKMLLSKGWTDLDDLINTYNVYMQRKCHRYEKQFVKINNIYEI